MLRKAVLRLASTLTGALLLVAAAFSLAEAQGSTGKIQGRVTNAQTGDPIAAAQVIVEGTTLGNITNDDGFYFINDVPAGLHSIRATSIGYRPVVVSDQRVLAGQTATVDFKLEQTAVEIEPLIVTGERNPLVPRDQVSSKAIVTGETIDQLPLDNASSIILLQPGVISTNNGRSIRGSRPGEEAVYVDGVPIRTLRTGNTDAISLPTNALAQADVTTGGVSPQYGNAQGGLINYVTRTGGTALGGTVTLFTDELGPKDWRTGFNRGELSVGGPVPMVNNLSFFFGGTASGTKYNSLPQGFDNIPLYIQNGVDSTFTLARTGAVSGMADSVAVPVPHFEAWNNGPTSPTRVSDRYNLTAKLSYSLPRGSKLDLSYYRNRSQTLNRGLTGLYNSDAWGGSYSTGDVLTLGGRFLINQSANSAIALDLKASYQRDWAQSGTVDFGWLHDHLTPAFGFNFSNIDFIYDPDHLPVTQKLVDAIRSGVIPADSLQVAPNRADLTQLWGVAGVSDNLRLNPYGMRTAPRCQSCPSGSMNISGLGNAGQSFSEEKRWYFSGAADWQMNRFNRLWFGGDVTMGDAQTLGLSLYSGNSSANLYKPKVAGLFAQDRLDLGDVVLEGGVRMDYFDPDGVFPRIPGYAFNVPDSLKADFVEVAPGDGPILDRVQPLADCGGEATAFRRARADGTLVCENNFIKAKTRTGFSPHIAVSFPVTTTSTFRLSYGQNLQVPALTGGGGELDDIYTDLTNSNTNATYGRDVQIPRTVLFEAGYRQVFGGATVVDVAAYSKTTRNSLTYRKVPFDDPNTGQTIYINALTNADFSLARGVDVRFDRRFSEIADLNVSYSFLDARGTGSDPNTYTGLILRRNTNLSIITGSPVAPPELLLTLDESRTHNIGTTFSLSFPADFREGTAVGKVLQNVGIFATGQVASGLPYTRLLNNGNGQTGPPTAAGLGGIPAEGLNASRTPFYKQFDLLLQRAFRVGGNRMRIFADMRNPLHLANTSSVYLETGRSTNEVLQEKSLDDLLRDQTLDGDSNIDDFDIMRESIDNGLNKYMLLQAEKRFGNGDGIFTVDEQRAAFGAWYNVFYGPQFFRRSDRSLRLGVEYTF